MIDAQLPLQGAIYSAVTGSLVMKALLGGRLFDQVPTGPDGKVRPDLFPYCSFGSMTSLDESTHCTANVSISVQIDCWSREVGWTQAKQIAAALAELLNAKIPVSGFSIVLHRVERVVSTRERDGRTSRVAVYLRYDLTRLS